MKRNFFSVVLLMCLFSLIGVSCSTSSGVDPKNFVDTVGGKPIALYTLSNDNGMKVRITNYGGRIVSILVPDKNGAYQDVVLGHDSIADYENIDGNFGALIGRYGNRINKGQFTLDGKQYQLPINDHGHSLHGGPVGFHHKVWDAKQLDRSTLELTLTSPDGEAGYPGTLKVKVVYKVTPDNALSISYTATTDKPTIVNLTNHSYFNLSGDPSKNILDEEVMISADSITPIDSTFMTHNTMLAVKGTPFDFRTAKKVGKDLNADNEQLKNGNGYDHNFVLNTHGDINKVSASVYDPTSGIMMEVYTVEPGIQFYIGNFLNGKVKGKKGIAYPLRSAMALETQHYPNSPNCPSYPPTVLRPGQTYKSQCIYKFKVVK
jgi:aldose 1-epimerase